MNKSTYLDVNQQPLRYRISDWRQLRCCQSNNSRDLSVSVTVFVNDPRLNGLRIQVNHRDLGVLFACVIDASGCILSPTDSGSIYQFTSGQILEELKKFGFDVVYNPVENLPGDQIQFLMTLNALHYDKIRIMNVWKAPLGTKEYKWCVVVFNSEAHGDWLNANYSPSESEFTSGVMNGTAMNISALSETNNYRWDWLYNWVGSIDDIIEENSTTSI